MKYCRQRRKSLTDNAAHSLRIWTWPQPHRSRPNAPRTGTGGWVARGASAGWRTLRASSYRKGRLHAIYRGTLICMPTCVVHTTYGILGAVELKTHHQGGAPFNCCTTGICSRARNGGLAVTSRNTTAPIPKACLARQGWRSSRSREQQTNAIVNRSHRSCRLQVAYIYEIETSPVAS